MVWGDLITLEYGKPVKDKACTDGSVPVYGTNGQIGTSHLPPLCKRASMILGRKGAYRGVHYSDVPFSVIDTAFYAEPLTDRLDMKWAYYKFLTYDINRMDSGSAIPSTDRYEIYKIAVDLPPLDAQKKVVRLLDSLDAKITCNQQINANLSDLLHTLYQSAFGHNAQKNNVGCLSDVCELSKERVAISDLTVENYFSTENMLPNKLGVTSATALPAVSQVTKCKKGNTLISNIRPYFKKIYYCQSNCGCSTDVICFVPKTALYSAFLFFTLYADCFFDYMVVGAKGTKMPRGDKHHIMAYPIKIPADEELFCFNAIAEPTLAFIDKNRIENKRLSCLRDTLLPRLMSGELDVSGFDL